MLMADTNFTEGVIIMKLLEREREAELDKWTELGVDIKNNPQYKILGRENHIR